MLMRNLITGVLGSIMFNKGNVLALVAMLFAANDLVAQSNATDNLIKSVNEIIQQAGGDANKLRFSMQQFTSCVKNSLEALPKTSLNGVDVAWIGEVKKVLDKIGTVTDERAESLVVGSGKTLNAAQAEAAQKAQQSWGKLRL